MTARDATPRETQDGPTRGSRNLAARAAHWSATHRKTAIFGWLGFVVVAVLRRPGGRPEDDLRRRQFNGESGRAEHALEDAGLRPNDEVVLVQSQTADDRRPRVPDRDRADRRAASRGPRTSKNVKSPLARRCGRVRRPALGAGRVRDHRRRARGGRTGSTRAATRSTAVAGRAPRAARRAVRQRQHQQGAERDLPERPGEGGDAVAADHPADPGDRLRLAGGGAACRCCSAISSRDGGDGAGRAPEPDLPRRQQPLLGHPADRARGGRRLLALLPPTRARGARGRARRPRDGARRRGGDLGPRRPDLRA